MTAPDNAPDTAPDTGQTLDTAPSNLPPTVHWHHLQTRQKEAWYRQEAVLKAYRETGTVSHAAEACGLTPSAAYRWQDENTLGWRGRLEEARLTFGLGLVKVMHDRIADPNGNRGSDILLMFALKAAFPETFRDASAVVDSTARDLLSELRKRSRIRKLERQASGTDEPTPVEEAERLLSNRKD